MDAELIVSALERMQLRLRRHQLATDHVHLLGGNQHVVGGWLVRFPGGGRLATNVVKRVFIIHFEIWMFEFPSPGTVR